MGTIVILVFNQNDVCLTVQSGLCTVPGSEVMPRMAFAHARGQLNSPVDEMMHMSLTYVCGAFFFARGSDRKPDLKCVPGVCVILSPSVVR